jgi:hypothetical protein
MCSGIGIEFMRRVVARVFIAKFPSVSLELRIKTKS